MIRPMSAVLDQRLPAIPRHRRFGYLMAPYAENHDRFLRLFDPSFWMEGEHHISRVGDGLDVHLHVIERHRYTIELRLTYGLSDPVTGEPDPSAFLRLYRDARVLEATHCYVGRRWQDVLGLHPEPETLIGHRLRMNVFLGKWFEFLAGQGHSGFTLSRQILAAEPV